MRSRPTAGQASVEYIAALALVAALLVLAAPAVGAPNVGAIVAGKLRLGICLVAADICSDDAARAAGVEPCVLRSDTTGKDGFVTAFSIELGGREMLTVTPHSDGSVSVVRAAGVSGGGSAGLGADLSLGPIRFDVGVSGTVRERVQSARGWRFPDRATADRFLRDSRRDGVDERRWPATWRSVEDAREVAAMAGAAAGGKGFDDRGDLIGLGGSAQAAVGARRASDGLVTLYGRVGFDGPEVSLPLVPSIERGRQEWLVEYTFGPSGPRELAFRRSEPGHLASRVTETVGRLDLRDPTNLRIARRLVDTRWPWPPDVLARLSAVGDRIATHGVVERAVYDVADESKGISGSIRGGAKFGAGARRIEIHKRLLDASARTGGSHERERFDCLDQP